MDINSINELAATIISGYRQPGDAVNKPDNLPDRAEVVAITELLRRLIFPGYFDENGASTRGGDDYFRTLTLIVEVERRLRRQICLSLNLGGEAVENCDDVDCRAERICATFLHRVPELREILLTDVQAAYDGDPAARDKHEIIFAYPGIFATTVYRLAHELHILSVPLIPRMMTEYAHSLTGIEIHPGATIGHHFFIDHGTGIVIGETTEIGAFVKLYQGVTLGALSTRGGQSLRGKKRHPTLEDEVTVYSGASILGGDTVIGRGSVIGGNAFVLQSVPPDTSISVKQPEHDVKGLRRGAAPDPARETFL